MIKVIFLDFDGVINNWNHFEGVDFNNFKYLIEIIKATDAKIVVTSSKKHTFQIDTSIDMMDTCYYRDYVSVLNDYGIEIFDITPYVYESRKLEIIKYLEMHPEVEEFLILDDDGIIKKPNCKDSTFLDFEYPKGTQEDMYFNLSSLWISKLSDNKFIFKVCVSSEGLFCYFPISFDEK